MTRAATFHTLRLSGRPPRATAALLYAELFGPDGPALLERDMQDFQRHQIAPWTLCHAGHEIGVGGFRIGFGDDGTEILFHFLAEAWGQGLASEFVGAAIDYGQLTLRETRFFGHIDPNDQVSRRILEKAGFTLAEAGPLPVHGGASGPISRLKMVLS